MRFSTIVCFFQLVRREMHLFFKGFRSRLIDLSFGTSTWVIVFGYLMVHSGLKDNYGSFILVGAIASFGLFETTWRATLLAQDVTDKKITNELILPMRSVFRYFSLITH